MAFLLESETDTQESEPSKAGGPVHWVNAMATRNLHCRLPHTPHGPHDTIHPLHTSTRSTDTRTHPITQPRPHTDAQKLPNIYIKHIHGAPGSGEQPDPQCSTTQRKGYPNTRRTAPWGNNPVRMQIVRPARGLVVNQS